MTVRHACTAVGCKYPDRTATGDLLQYACDYAGDLGFTALKVFLSSNYNGAEIPARPDYAGQNWDTTYTNLAGLAADSGYVAVFSDARFNRFFIDVWAFATGIFNPWLNDISTAQLAAEYTEWYNLAKYLLQTYSGKEFVLQSGAESDWTILGDFNPQIEVPPYRLERYTAVLNVHQRAVEDARRDWPSTSTVIHAIEVNRVLDDYGVRMHRDAFPLIKVDAISYTAYECFGDTAYPGGYLAGVQFYVTKALKRIKAAMPGTRVYIGEYAWPQDEAWFIGTGVAIGTLIQAILDIADAEGVTDVVWWQIFDNEEQSPGVPRGFSLYDRNGSSTTPGARNDAGDKYFTLLNP